MPRKGGAEMRMRRHALGNTGIEVGEIGFGAEWIGELDDEVTFAMMDRIAAAGGNLVDCWMADPKIRTSLGKSLAGRRGEWIIQGHVGATWQDGQYVRTRDVEQCKVAFDDLLERLQTDHVELGMIHYVDEMADFENLMGNGYIDYVHELHDQGVIEHVGFSTHSAVVGKAAVLSGEIEMMMFSINPAYDMMPAVSRIEELSGEGGGYDLLEGGVDPERAELYAMCAERGIGLTVMKGYAGGMLLDASKSPFGVAMTPVQCIHYALTRPSVCSVLAGTKSVAQVEDALAYCSASPEERDYEKVLSEAPRHSYRGQCIYCGHCSPCSVGIDIALANKLHDLAVAADTVPASVREHVRNMSASAIDCTGCRDCESRCPFGVPIAEKMAAAAALFSA